MLQALLTHECKTESQVHLCMFTSMGMEAQRQEGGRERLLEICRERRDGHKVVRRECRRKKAERSVMAANMIFS